MPSFTASRRRTCEWPRENRRPAQCACRSRSLGEAAGYKLIVEDDGQGLSTERIKEAAA